jgi:hypothetical protein
MEEIYGKAAEFDDQNMAEKIWGTDTETAEKPSRGPKEDIDEEDLLTARNHLVWLLETTWMDVGDKLSAIKTPADVLAAIQIWGERSHEYVVQALLRPASRPATGRSLKKTRRRIGELNVIRNNAWEYREKCRQSLEVAKRALSPELSEGEKLVVDEQIAKRVEEFAQAEARHQIATRRQTEMEQVRQEGETYFARAEFVDFCRSGRYRLRPLNIANAFAGLPFIGWRRSVERCRDIEAAGANGGSLQIFDTITRIIRSCARRSELVKHAERWLKDQGKTDSYGVTDLQEHWFYLRWAMKTVLEAKIRTRDLPFAIAREYDRRKTHPSNVDLLFAEEERIIVN